MEFNRIKLEAADFIRKCLKASPSRQMINCFESFYFWRYVYNISYAEMGGAAVVNLNHRGDEVFFYPFGDYDIEKVIPELKKYCEEKGISLKFIKVLNDQANELNEHFPDRFTVEPVRNNFEYVYETETFRFYRGAGLQSKRNFVNYAHKNYEWKYERVGAENIEECRAFSERFVGNTGLDSDNVALQSALDDFDRVVISGGVIRIDGEISAMLMTSPLEDGKTAAGMFLRADHGKKGVVPLLYQQYFTDKPQFEYFNLAEDLGLEGLRKNKLSYDPCEILELNDVTFL